MLMELSLITITLIILGISSYTDLKSREVPDLISYSLIFLALGLRLIFATTLGWQIILEGIFGALVFSALGILLYYTHQWGGADAKLLMGLGAVIGISFPITWQSFQLLILLFLLLLSGAIYGLFWMFYLAIANRTLFVNKFNRKLRLTKTIQIISWAVTLILLIISISQPTFWPLVFFPVVLTYLIMFVMVIEDNMFTKLYAIDELTPGDWLAEPVIVENKAIISHKTLQEEDITKLKQLKKKNKLHTITVKEGIPFIPSFFIAYVVLLILKYQLLMFN